MEINAILIDDNPHALEGIKAAVDWGASGVNLIATFIDIFEAKAFLDDRSEEL